MPPKKASASASAAAALPKGQSSLSSFFGGKTSSSSSSSSPIAKDSSSTAEKYLNQETESIQASKYFQPKSKTDGSNRANPVVIDDDSDGETSKVKPKASSASSAKPRASISKTGAVKRKAAESSDSSDLDTKPKPKRAATSAKTTASPTLAKTTRRKSAATNIISDQDDDDDDFVPSKILKPTNRHATKTTSVIETDSDDDNDDDDVKGSRKSKTSTTASASRARANVKQETPRVPSEAAAKPATLSNAPAESPKPSVNKGAAWRDMAAKRAAGPSNPGSKEIPVGQPNCLAGLTLVFTGELTSISRDEAADLAKRYGARITGAPSSKTTYVVVGEGAGPKKLEAIKKNKIPTLNEDGFLNLIATRGAGQLDAKAKQKIVEEENKIRQVAQSMGPPKGADPNDFKNMLWTSKYAPKQLKDLVGNKAAVEKLQSWLQAWPSSYKCNFKKPSPHAINTYRAVLISGPPGIGKTSSAHLIAKHEGYTPIEFNASDTRSKLLIESILKDTVNNKSLDGWYNNGKVDNSLGVQGGVKITDRTVLIMDEVDGMSGGDRGGIGAINALIKKTKVPIICICNDRRNTKMRPFEHTTANLTFRKPDIQAIKSRMMSISFKEKLKIPGEVMGQLIESAQGDIRSIINMMSTWKLSKDTMNFDESKALGQQNAKPGMHTPFSLYSELSSPYMFSQTSRKSLNEKADLYFQDHSFVPLMVAENYLKSRPARVQREPDERLRGYKHLEMVKLAAESISDGDMVDRMIHGSEQHWSLMPLHAIASAVRPCWYVHGQVEGGFPSFPSWLGQNSKQQRLSRAVVDLHAKMRLSASATRHDLRHDYLPFLFSRLIDPLLQDGTEGVEQVISTMDDYYLAIEDRDAILELGLEPNNVETMIKKIPSTVKASFTRKFNSSSHPIAFYKTTTNAGLTKMKQIKSDSVPDLEDVIEEEIIDEVENDDTLIDDDDLSKDQLVRKPKSFLAKSKSKKESSK